MDKIINLTLIKHPLNWMTTLLMTILFSMAVDIIARRLADTSPASQPQSLS